MSQVIVLGAQWGDEGKGKIIDILSAKADIVVRSHGGNNAGHSVLWNKEEYKFHLIPSGVLYPNVIAYITGGTVVDLEGLVQEIEGLERKGICLKDRLKISDIAHVIMPYHRLLDKLYESKRRRPLGTTGKGIGPCYADKANRLGVRIKDLYRDSFSQLLEELIVWKNRELESLGHPPLDSRAVEEEYAGLAKKLSPYVTSFVEEEIAEVVGNKGKVLFEGAHGTYLDLTFGTYPYVTSSCTLASGVLAGAAIGPNVDVHVLAVVKCYTTRVGEGPLPTELSAAEAALFSSHEGAREIATTTGRKRRMGWFDAPLVRRALQCNGASSMAIMKIDVLDKLSKIRICVAYELDGKRLHCLPTGIEDWNRLVPIYEEMEGWMQDTGQVASYEELPLQAKRYLQKLEELCGCPISFISYGPQREKTIVNHFVL